MKTIIEKTHFTEEDKQLDVNFMYFHLYRNPLVIATRQGQIVRINKWLDEAMPGHRIRVTGWWHLDPKSNRDTYYRHDCIIFLDPDRCSDKTIYQSMIAEANALPVRPGSYPAI